MNLNKKIESLKNFSKKLKYTQKIVCSDEGSLNILEPKQQKIYTPKPKGVWYAYGKAWIDFLIQDDEDDTWCKKRIACINWIYNIKLSDKVLILKMEDFPDFEKKWANAARDGINWAGVARKYAGIDIRLNPRMYSENRQYHSYWSWNWDVSSGCIWHPSGIKSVKLIKEYVPTWKESK